MPLFISLPIIISFHPGWWHFWQHSDLINILVFVVATVCLMTVSHACLLTVLYRKMPVSELSPFTPSPASLSLSSFSPFPAFSSSLPNYRYFVLIRFLWYHIFDLCSYDIFVQMNGIAGDNLILPQTLTIGMTCHWIFDFLFSLLPLPENKTFLLSSLFHYIGWSFLAAITGSHHPLSTVILWELGFHSHMLIIYETASYTLKSYRFTNRFRTV